MQDTSIRGTYSNLNFLFHVICTLAKLLTNWTDSFQCIFPRADNACTHNIRYRLDHNIPQDIARDIVISLTSGNVGQSSNNR